MNQLFNKIAILFLLLVGAALPGNAQDESDISKELPDFTQGESNKKYIEAHIDAVTAYGKRVADALADHEARMMTMTARAKRLSPREQCAFVRRLKPGEYVNVPAFWRTVAETKTLIDALYTFGEPLTPDMLAALERHLPHIRTERNRTRVAALLYRYGRKSGTDALAKRLRDYKRNRDSASLPTAIFVLNREPRFLPLCGEAIRYDLVHTGSDGTGVLHIASGWRIDSVQPLLARIYAKYPQDPGVVALVGKYKVTNVAPIVENTFRTTDQVDVRMHAGAALVALDPSRREEVMFVLKKAFLEGTDTRDGRHARWSVLSGLIATENKDALPLARIAIREFVAAKLTPTEENEEVLLANRDRMELAVLGTKAISLWSSKEDIPLLEALLTRQGKDNYELDTVKLLFRLSPNSATLKRVTGEAWVTKTRTTSRLKQLPDWLSLEERSLNEWIGE